ncbi:MAG: hypothetical protein M3419_08870 [Actinomycetota bacterium]|nr:hypothetical protein [Actinomycetota bacterium]
MTTRTPVRLAASLAALTLGLSLAPAAGAAPSDQRSTPRSALATDWQADELTNGAMVNEQFDFVDYGLTIDTLFSLAADGRKLRYINRIGTRLERNADAYTTFDGTRFAGASAKLLVAAKVLREPVRDFGGRNSRLDVLRLVAGERAGSEEGRIRDSSARGGGSDFSNNIGQSLGVIGLSRTGGVPKPVVTYLLRQQCSDGGFRQDPVIGRSCVRSGGSSNVDTTALALQALVTAKEKGGVRVRAERLVRATRYLARQQKDNGSFTLGRAQGPSNANSTGLAAQALKVAGRPCLAEAARPWMRTLQIVRGKAGDGPARRDLGAIAFTRRALSVALVTGVTTATRDEFRRATAQGVFAFVPTGLDELAVPR